MNGCVVPEMRSPPGPWGADYPPIPVVIPPTGGGIGVDYAVAVDRGRLSLASISSLFDGINLTQRAVLFYIMLQARLVPDAR